MAILLRPPQGSGVSQVGPAVVGASVTLLFDQVLLPASVKWVLRVDDFVADSMYTCELIAQANSSATEAPHQRYASSGDVIDFTIDTSINAGFLVLRITNNEAHDITCTAMKIQII